MGIPPMEEHQSRKTKRNSILTSLYIFCYCVFVLLISWDKITVDCFATKPMLCWSPEIRSVTYVCLNFPPRQILRMRYSDTSGGGGVQCPWPWQRQWARLLCSQQACGRNGACCGCRHDGWTGGVAFSVRVCYGCWHDRFCGVVCCHQACGWDRVRCGCQHDRGIGGVVCSRNL